MGQEHQDKAVGQKHQGKSKSIGTRVLGKGHPDMGFEARAEGHGRRDMVLQVRDIGEGALEQNQWEKGTEHGQRGSLILLQISWYSISDFVQSMNTD